MLKQKFHEKEIVNTSEQINAKKSRRDDIIVTNFKKRENEQTPKE